MTTLCLNCVIVGGGAAVCIEIAASKRVGALKEALKARRPGVVTCEADALTLYVARQPLDTSAETMTAAAWPSDEHPDMEALTRPTSVTEELRHKYLCVENAMKPTRCLSRYFTDAETVNAADDMIHVLVQRPSFAQTIPGADNATATSVAAEAAYGSVLPGKRPRWRIDPSSSVSRPRYRLSDATSWTCMAMLKALGLPYSMQTETVTSQSEPELAACPRVEPFKWPIDSSSSKSRSSKCRSAQVAYLNAQLADMLAAKKLCVYGVNHGDEEVLAVHTDDLPFEVVGAADVLLLDDAAAISEGRDLHGDEVQDDNEAASSLECVRELRRLALVINVKPPSQVRLHAFQTVSQLLAADLRVAKRPALALLTSLTDHWQFFWLGDDRAVHSLRLTSAASGFTLIRKVLQSVFPGDGGGSSGGNVGGAEQVMYQDYILFAGRSLTRSKLSAGALSLQIQKADGQVAGHLDEPPHRRQRRVDALKRMSERTETEEGGEQNANAPLPDALAKGVWAYLPVPGSTSEQTRQLPSTDGQYVIPSLLARRASHPPA